VSSEQRGSELLFGPFNITHGPDHQEGMEEILEHALSLDLLCHLSAGAPLSTLQLRARNGWPLSLIHKGLALLSSFRLVDKVGESDNRGWLFAATLDGHPDWVREAVEDYRADRQRDSR
jgi:hypothetical protein